MMGVSLIGHAWKVLMRTLKPVNHPPEMRQSDNWPTGRAKARYRKAQRRKIAREAQRRRDEEAQRSPHR